MNLVVRPVESIDECRHIEALISAAWGAGREIAVPDHLLITLAKNKGVVLLAWDNDRPVGFSFSFPSFVETAAGEHRLKHCSHMTGVIPEYRGRRVGEQLKWAQREHVLDQGIDHITWTYDPLETANANLNVRKLGVVCETFMRNVYGDARDALSKGLPTDRFQVDWWLDAPHVVARRSAIGPRRTRIEWLAAGAREANAVERSGDLMKPVAIRAPGDAARVIVNVPHNFQVIKGTDMALAAAWRSHTRGLFEQFFAADYTVIDYLPESGQGAYLLAKGWTR